MDGFVDLLRCSGQLEMDKTKHHKVYRFIRRGVDKVMENEKKPTSSFNPAHKGFGRVAYFLASGVEKEHGGKSLTTSSLPNRSHKYVSCFVRSKIEKGEGHPGGGNGPDFLNIGFNPQRRFKEIRVKRQQKHTDTVKPLPRPLAPDRKSSSEILRLKLQHEELLAEIQANYELKNKQKEEMEREKQMEYEDMTKYNPWGQPSAGAPKVSRSGKLCTHLCGIKMNNEEYFKKYDLFGQPRRALPACGNDGAQEWKRRKHFFEWSMSDYERNRLHEGKERSAYQVKCLERQKARKRQRDQAKTGSPNGFIWGKSTDVNRNISGKIGLRKRRLYSLDPGACQESHDTYFSIADKIVRRMPANPPGRGVVNHDSYRTWGKSATVPVMKSKDNRKLEGKTSSNDCITDNQHQCQDNASQHSAECGTTSVAPPTKVDDTL